MANQTAKGKAFEYAFLNSLYVDLRAQQQVEILQSNPLHTAQNFYQALPEDEKAEMDAAAAAAVRKIKTLEPSLENHQQNIPLTLEIQADARGSAGDVRDVLCVRRGNNNWEIGISCKHNHHAVKHSRLSDTLNFGNSWFGISCSDEYFARIRPLFEELRDLKAHHVLWCNVENKAERFYVPILQAFIDEMIRLNNNTVTIPRELIHYLLGRNDFYKVISIEARRTTEIQAYNFNGTLSRAAGGVRPQHRIPVLRLPTRIHNIDFSPRTNTTIIIACDEGWTVSLRIHNASLRVEPSLKFDVQLIGIPPAVENICEQW